MLNQPGRTGLCCAQFSSVHSLRKCYDYTCLYSERTELTPYNCSELSRHGYPVRVTTKTSTVRRQVSYKGRNRAWLVDQTTQRVVPNTGIRLKGGGKIYKLWIFQCLLIMSKNSSLNILCVILTEIWGFVDLDLWVTRVKITHPFWAHYLLSKFHDNLNIFISVLFLWTTGNFCLTVSEKSECLWETEKQGFSVSVVSTTSLKEQM